MAKKISRESMGHRLHRLASNRSMLWLVSTFVFFSAFLAVLVLAQFLKFDVAQRTRQARYEEVLNSAVKPAINDDLLRGVKAQDYEYLPIGTIESTELRLAPGYSAAYYSDDDLTSFEQSGKVLVQRCKWSGSSEQGYICEGGVLLEVDAAKSSSDEAAGPPPYWKVVKSFTSQPDVSELKQNGFPSEVTDYWE